MCEESKQVRGARRQREERGSAAMAAGGGSSRNKATVSTAHRVCVCVFVNASVLVSLPLLSALDETKKLQ
jgi:hypothetical protein